MPDQPALSQSVLSPPALAQSALARRALFTVVRGRLADDETAALTVVLAARAARQAPHTHPAPPAPPVSWRPYPLVMGFTAAAAWRPSGLPMFASARWPPPAHVPPGTGAGPALRGAPGGRSPGSAQRRVWCAEF